MKKVISNDELKLKIKEAINLICDAVSSTLGPSGNNVLISSDISPYITNDGVTIAREISSSDKVINAILDVIKEATLKTNEKVGDGTTTTLVLLKSIFYEGLKEIESGVDPILLKRELNNSLNKIIKEIYKLSKMPNDKQLLDVAINSSEDEEIGKIVTDVYSKVKSRFAIKLEESKTEKTYYDIKSGYNLDIETSSVYFDNNDEIIINNCYVLILSGYLESLEQISDIINESIERNKNIIIFCSDFNDDIKNDVLLYKIQLNKNVFLYKIPDYGLRNEIVLNDINALSNSKIKNIGYESILFSDLGFINKLIIKRQEIILVNNVDIKDRAFKLEKLKDKTDDLYDLEFIESSLAKLKLGIATIYVGGYTKVEKREKIMRFEDAICAVEQAINGVVIGEGVTYLKASSVLEDNTASDRILKKALKMPFEKIMENSGIDIKVENDIIKYGCDKIYNINNNSYENIDATKIIDPTSVVIESLKNAVSIASIILTTNYLVLNEQELEKKLL